MAVRQRHTVQMMQVCSLHSSCQISQLTSVYCQIAPAWQVASPSECFWSGAGDGFVAFSATSEGSTSSMGFLLVSCSNHSHKMHRSWARAMTQMDGMQLCLSRTLPQVKVGGIIMQSVIMLVTARFVVDGDWCTESVSEHTASSGRHWWVECIDEEPAIGRQVSGYTAGWCQSALDDDASARHWCQGLSYISPS